MVKEHNYTAHIKWTGNIGNGTAGYREYSRDHVICIENKPDLQGSSDPAFMGDINKYNPEELLVCSLSSCHMLWYLHLCAEAGIIVTAYSDNATGIMIEEKDGSGRFSEVRLNPFVTVSHEDMMLSAIQLHQKAHNMCFIANSMNFPILHFPNVHAI
jgi:organic hydroperoxide reductase OsmC/OhrA